MRELILSFKKLLNYKSMLVKMNSEQFKSHFWQRRRRVRQPTYWAKSPPPSCQNRGACRRRNVTSPWPSNHLGVPFDWKAARALISD